MEHIYTNAFRAPDALLYLRRVCHNILDWGTRSRLETVQQRSNDMYNFERTAIAEDAAKSKQQSQAKEQSQGAGLKKKRKLEAGSVSESLCMLNTNVSGCWISMFLRESRNLESMPVTRQITSQPSPTFVPGGSVTSTSEHGIGIFTELKTSIAQSIQQGSDQSTAYPHGPSAMCDG